MNTEPCLDAATLEKLLQIGGRDFTVKMIELFMSYVPEKLMEARAAEQDGDLERVQKAVHPIKSSAMNIGARNMRDLAERIEQHALDREREPIAPMLAELEAMYEQVRLHLQEYLNSSLR
jgi:HPt (histidine-containing phosphotransfer) domain-containing protein